MLLRSLFKFEFYLGKMRPALLAVRVFVPHEPRIDLDRRREQLARIGVGVSGHLLQRCACVVLAQLFSDLSADRNSRSFTVIPQRIVNNENRLFHGR
jgi:hypothetical protein